MSDSSKRRGRPRGQSRTSCQNGDADALLQCPSFDLNVSVSPVQPVKKSCRVRKPTYKVVNQPKFFPKSSDSIMIDTSSLAKHSEVTFVTENVHGVLNDQSVLVVPQSDPSVHDVLVDSGDTLCSVATSVSAVPDSIPTPLTVAVIPENPPSSVNRSSEFFSVDPSILENLFNDKTNPSEASDNWCRNRFDAWRVAKDIDKSRKIEAIPLKELSELLARYFLEMAKKNGQRYPTESLMNLYNGFNCILQNDQRKRLNETGQVEPLFCITKHPFFLNVNKAINKSMELSIQVCFYI
jgi:hypothetical protein